MQERDEQPTDKIRSVNKQGNEAVNPAIQQPGAAPIRLSATYMQGQPAAATRKVTIATAEADPEHTQLYAAPAADEIASVPTASLGNFDMLDSDKFTNSYVYPGQRPAAPAPYPPVPPYGHELKQPLPVHAPGQPLPVYVPGQPQPVYVPGQSQPIYTAGQARPMNLPEQAGLSYAPASKVKAPLYFPLVRQAPAPLQFFGMLFYSVFMAICIMLITLYQINVAQTSSSTLISMASSDVDSSHHGLSVLLTLVLVLLIVPGCSLLSGTFFGSWRGLLVSLVSVGGGLLITLLSNWQFANGRGLDAALPLLGLPCSALVVGLIYERRRYAAWWKSMLTLMLGAAIVSCWFLISILMTGDGAASVATNAAAASNPQVYMVNLWSGAAILALACALALTFPSSILEGLIHRRIAAVKNRAR